ncbi:MAG TPA: DNA-3-methyladenine glycosylase I [Gemmatimonas sp.]|nr:DNA-3-methyladenine glycosylase I [Gemmatimonas sp.]
MPRCPWPTKPLDIEYHDREWGVPVHDDRTLFEFITLEGAQAGLSWSTVLAKRDGYRRAFADWDIAAIAGFTSSDVERLVLDPSIVRHRGKVASTITNAQAFVAMQREFGSFDAYVWRVVGGAPRDGRRESMRDVPSRTPESDALSKDLQGRGFKFVGSTICYAFMQATGMVNDHLLSCERHDSLGM